MEVSTWEEKKNSSPAILLLSPLLHKSVTTVVDNVISYVGKIVLIFGLICFMLRGLNILSSRCLPHLLLYLLLLLLLL